MNRAIILMLLLAGCGAPVGRRQGVVVLREAPDVALAPVPGPAYMAKTSRLMLFRPRSVRATHDTLFICDSGNDRVRVVDGDLDEVVTFGRTGSGPGELKNPPDMRLHHGMVGVLDNVNRRVNVYDDDGTYRYDFVLPGSAVSFGFLGTGRIVVPDETGGHAFAVIDSSGGVLRLGRRAPAAPGVRPAYPNARERMRGRGIDQVAVMGDTVAVADNVTGVIALYSADGTMLAAMALPLDLLQAVFDRLREVDKGFGGRNLYSEVYQDLSVEADGRLLLPVGLPDVAVVIVDPSNRTVARVMAPAGSTGAGARSAVSIARIGRRFIFAGYNGISIYRTAAR
jgi:hypothetical protein